MSSGARRDSNFEVFAGVAIIVALVIVAAYFLDAAGECLRYNVTLLHAERFLDRYPRAYRVAVGLIAALLLYGGLWALHRFLHLFRKPGLEILVIVIGVVLAGVFPSDFFGTLCHAP